MNLRIGCLCTAGPWSARAAYARRGLSVDGARTAPCATATAPLDENAKPYIRRRHAARRSSAAASLAAERGAANGGRAPKQGDPNRGVQADGPSARAS